MMFTKILIANRGEIACRIIRTCRKLGIRTVAVYSQADATAQHVRLADEAWPIGGPRPQDSYLCGDVIVDVAKKTGAQAIHPGYGFLSENADFADAVEAAGLVFIGPKAASMRKMGSKAGAKELMASHHVPVVPGYTGHDQDSALLQNEANRIGYPLMIKAAHGGGGKGMRIVRNADEFSSSLESCQREAKSAFGRDRVLLERYIEKPRHIEIQVFADSHGNTIHLGERECSAQRRYQKVIEESPSPFLTPAMRERMGAAAVTAAKSIEYINAGTVEFIVGMDGDFYFMEINTRLQVEHPVTEMVTGYDLVEWQLLVAAGEPLPARQSDIRSRGHAIEVRLYAEDPNNNFLPGSGRLETLRLPKTSAHVRIDGGVIEGDLVSIFYDPMIAKLVVWDEDRPRALARLRIALSDCDIAGPKSNIDFLERLIRHAVVVEGRIDTSYLDNHLNDVLATETTPDSLHLAASACAAMLFDETNVQLQAKRTNDPQSPWAIADSWRIGHSGQRRVCFLHQAKRIELVANGSHGCYQIEYDNKIIGIEHAQLSHGVLNACINGTSLRFRAEVDAHRVILHDGDSRLSLLRTPAFRFESASSAGSGNKINAPMPGRIVLISVIAGDSVTEGQELAVMEAMKMELSLKSPRDGSVVSVQMQVGDFVEADAVLICLEQT